VICQLVNYWQIVALKTGIVLANQNRYLHSHAACSSFFVRGFYRVKEKFKWCMLLFLLKYLFANKLCW
jgi:hypothetical protein